MNLKNIVILGGLVALPSLLHAEAYYEDLNGKTNKVAHVEGEKGNLEVYTTDKEAENKGVMATVQTDKKYATVDVKHNKEEGTVTKTVTVEDKETGETKSVHGTVDSTVAVKNKMNKKAPKPAANKNK